MGCSKDEGKKTLQADINLYKADSQDNYKKVKLPVAQSVLRERGRK